MKTKSRHLILSALLCFMPLIPAFSQGWNVDLVGNISYWDKGNNVVLQGNYAYVAAFWSGLKIVDISNPTSPVEVGHWDTPDCA
jgi:hypothetical protein